MSWSQRFASEKTLYPACNEFHWDLWVELSKVVLASCEERDWWDNTTIPVTLLLRRLGVFCQEGNASVRLDGCSARMAQRCWFCGSHDRGSSAVWFRFVARDDPAPVLAVCSWEVSLVHLVDIWQWEECNRRPKVWELCRLMIPLSSGWREEVRVTHFLPWRDNFRCYWSSDLVRGDSD